jgi:hypothetical protein
LPLLQLRKTLFSAPLAWITAGMAQAFSERQCRERNVIRQDIPELGDSRIN